MNVCRSLTFFIKLQQYRCRLSHNAHQLHAHLSQNSSSTKKMGLFEGLAEKPISIPPINLPRLLQLLLLTQQLKRISILATPPDSLLQARLDSTIEYVLANMRPSNSLPHMELIKV